MAFISMADPVRIGSVSYTHLDVYKRQVLVSVLACGLAQRGRIGGDIQNVIDHLKGQPDRRTKLLRCV